MNNNMKKLQKISNCICLGKKAGWNLTNEKYMLCVKLDGKKEYRTKMTKKEYEKIKVVVDFFLNLKLIDLSK
jgi:hypothetical protein